MKQLTNDMFNDLLVEVKIRARVQREVRFMQRVGSLSKAHSLLFAIFVAPGRLGVDRAALH